MANVSGDERVVSLLSAEQVRRLTGLSKHQLAYWDETGFFSPRHSGERGERFGRVYSFEDLVGLRVIALMRHGGVPLQELRRVGQWLHGNRGSWSGRTFYVRGKRVYWDDDQGVRIGTRQPGQAEMPIAMDQVAEDMRAAVSRMRRRQPDQIGKVERRRYVAGHQAVIAGTRIPLRTIRRLHDAGYDTEAIRREYPQLTDEDVEVALESTERRRAS